MTAVETFQPLLEALGFIGGWAVAMLTGICFGFVK